MIFVTGGAGYIGSHTCVELLNAGHDVTVFDNFCNSQPEALRRVERITCKQLHVIKGDICNLAEMKHALQISGAHAVIHFAGLKAVGDSEEHPLQYYENNVKGTLTLLQAMMSCGIKTIVFSSSATVYGIPKFLPYTEAHPLAATNTYGQTKLTVEHMLHDLYRSDTAWHIGILRYFNPVGAHASGLIGEDPQGTPNNLMPFVAQVAVGRREFLNVWGNDYDTPDGTGVRDYIHVVDLALGHLAALNRLQTQAQCLTANLGTGIGYSVLDMVRAFEQACSKPIPFQFSPRRAGDIASYFADPKLAAELLNWQAKRDLATMCQDTWRWQSQNPLGYSSV
ncbi:UDP-glucose 4-epimerase [Rhodoferax lithotrophicus]|uniref:UDP-glucose 4-epimerase n=2 Tax=Rhodoferax lithotrophicus TaxID=2798804 RepID=A0ABN6D5J6_9BURK|nr:UDP-glucose 4-epimerase [Rhodoferax sp. MIZ03]